MLRPMLHTHQSFSTHQCQGSPISINYKGYKANTNLSIFNSYLISPKL